jgi:hypothetical protein
VGVVLERYECPDHGFSAGWYQEFGKPPVCGAPGCSLAPVSVKYMFARADEPVPVDDAMIERLRESLWSTWGRGRQTTDWPSRVDLREALVAALGAR